MVIDQRPRVVEQHLLRHPAKAPEGALNAVQPGRLPLVPVGLHIGPPRVAQRRYEQVHPYRLAADRHRRRPEVDLQLPAGRRLKPQGRPRFGTQHLPQLRRRPLDRAQRHRDAVFVLQILAHHVAVAAMPAKALGQPVFQPVQAPRSARLSNRHPPARREVALHRVAAAPQLAGNPLAAPAQTVQPHHRRHLVRRQHGLSPRTVPPWRALPLQHCLQLLLLLGGGQFLMSSGGQFFMSPDMRK